MKSGGCFTLFIGSVDNRCLQNYPRMGCITPNILIKLPTCNGKRLKLPRFECEKSYFQKRCWTTQERLKEVEIMKSRSCLKHHWPETRESTDVGLIHSIPSGMSVGHERWKEAFDENWQKCTFRCKTNWHCLCLWKSTISLEPFSQNSPFDSLLFAHCPVCFPSSCICHLSSVWSVHCVACALKSLILASSWRSMGSEARYLQIHYSVTWSVCLNQVSFVLWSFHLRNIWRIIYQENGIGLEIPGVSLKPLLMAPLSHVESPLHCVKSDLTITFLVNIKNQVQRNVYLEVPDVTWTVSSLLMELVEIKNHVYLKVTDVTWTVCWWRPLWVTTALCDHTPLLQSDTLFTNHIIATIL